MVEINVNFLEKYKSIDKICRDMFNGKDGISSYIEEMENTPYFKQQKVNFWNDTYSKLKHYRWMRNQLAHEQPLDSDFCTEEDIDWLNDFYEDLLSCNDPLALANKQKEIINKNINSKQEEVYHQEINESQKYTSLWRKIINKIKSWFS